jgi:hypothetical protein
VAKLTRSKAGKGYHSAREALLLNGRFVLSRVCDRGVGYRRMHRIKTDGASSCLSLSAARWLAVCWDAPVCFVGLPPPTRLQCWQADVAYANMSLTCSHHGVCCKQCSTLNACPTLPIPHRLSHTA